MSEFPTDPYLASQQKWLYQDCVVVPTLRNLLEGQLENKRILDVGCGNGQNSLLFLKWGAQKIVGFDSSSEMIENCKRLQIPSNSVEFFHLNLTNFDLKDQKDQKKFHVATAIFVMQYVHEKEELKAGIQKIFENLEDGGIFVGLIPNGVENIKSPRNAGILLGAEIEKRGDPYVDGEMVKALFYDGDVVKCTSTMALHSNEFYEKCFREVGFQKVEWLAPTISEKGREILGGEFCSQFLNPPVDIVFRCFK